MQESTELKPNTYFVEISGSGLPEVDGLFIPSTAPPAKSESGTVSSPGYWNGRMAWDRADGRSARSPSLSYSNTYKSWRICRLDGHLAYDFTCDDDMPPTEGDWHVYKKGVAPAPKVVIHHFDPRLPCPKPNVVFVLGGPGTGKGTMCKVAEMQLGWTHLSTGDLLRAERQTNGPHASVIEQSIAAGRLVPNEIVARLLGQAMEKNTRTTGNTNFLIDGFPRSSGNLEAWHEVIGADSELPGMVYFSCPYEVLEKRILGRSNHTLRSDDNIESIQLRFATFKEETLPTVEFFQSRGRCVEIDTSQDRRTVFSLLTQYLTEHTKIEFAPKALTEQSEILLGLRPWPKSVQTK